MNNKALVYFGLISICFCYSEQGNYFYFKYFNCFLQIQGTKSNMYWIKLFIKLLKLLYIYITIITENLSLSVTCTSEAFIFSGKIIENEGNIIFMTHFT